MRHLLMLACGLALIAAQPGAPDLHLFLEAGSRDARQSERALAELARTWRAGYVPLLIDVARLLVPDSAPQREDPFTRTLPDPRTSRDSEEAPRALVDPSATTRAIPPARARIIRFLERQTGQRFGNDLGRWREWMWARPYEPHPDYMSFKAKVYALIDPRMARFFTGRALIRLDEVDWGGVRVNGIPPLVSPKIERARDVAWLKDSHIVFGMTVGGEARAYPKRILAWHEMAHDRIGGVPVTVVYCTLCGTVIPYRSNVGGRHRTFGTSGLLYRSNKLMFDEETLSLWSTLDGRPVIGPLAGTGLTLEMLPVVTTTWGEWRRVHPATTVISVDTGFRRDYSEGAAYRDYFSTDELMFRVPRLDPRLRNKDEVLGLLLPARGGGRQAVAFAVGFLASHPIHHQTIEGRSVVVLTSPKGANRVYDVGDVRFVQLRGEAQVVDLTGRTWEIAEDALRPSAESGSSLPRLPAFRAFWFGWYAQFPETELVK